MRSHFLSLVKRLTAGQTKLQLPAQPGPVGQGVLHPAPPPTRPCCPCSSADDPASAPVLQICCVSSWLGGVGGWGRLAALVGQEDRPAGSAREGHSTVSRLGTKVHSADKCYSLGWYLGPLTVPEGCFINRGQIPLSHHQLAAPLRPALQWRAAVSPEERGGGEACRTCRGC